MSGSAPADAPSVDAEDVSAQDIVDYYRDHPVAFYEFLGFDLSDTQREILEAVQNYSRILVMSGNGTGKTAGVMLAAYHYWLFNWNSNVIGTSGQYAVMMDTAFPFLRTLHRRAQERFPNVPGHTLKSPPGISVDEHPEWWFRFYSPRDPDDLQGRHSRRAMVVIEEADKDGVTEGHFSAARSTATSGEDVVVAVANPPANPEDVVMTVRDDWHTIEFSSFDSHNVQRDLGELDGDERGRIPGLADLPTVAEDYEAYNSQAWPRAPARYRQLVGGGYPGVSSIQRAVRRGDIDRKTLLAILRPGAGTVRSAVTTDEDGRRVARQGTNLDPRWYRTRLGVLPPAGQSILRPWYLSDVDAAVQRYIDADPPAVSSTDRIEQFGSDIARGGGDRTVLVVRRDDGLLSAEFAEPTEDHARVTKPRLKSINQRLNRVGPWYIDALGEGSGVADDLRASCGARRYEASAKPHDDEEYRNARTEALVHLGDFLADEAMVRPNSDLETELRAGARVLELKERELAAGVVLQASSKDPLKSSDHLGRSPDILDAASICCWHPRPSNEYRSIDVGGVVG